MAQIPSDRLLLETDSPYCDVRPSHAGKQYVTTSRQAKDKKKYDPGMLVKGRNEPCNIAAVFEVVTGDIFAAMLPLLYCWSLTLTPCM